MNEVRPLLEDFWVCREHDREKYYRVKSDAPKFQRFVREQLGWKLIHTESLIKLEKIPAHAESFMGIQEFSEIRDYCILCVVLMFLEDREEQERFLLSELIDFVETGLAPYMQMDWTSFSQRKSLVRVLQYLEKLQILRVYEGSSEAFGQEAGREVLYENTGYSRYFAVSFARDISQCESWKDFEKADLELIVKESDCHPAIFADGPKAFRIIENLLSNAKKYSAKHSRVYVSVYEENSMGVFEIKNISAQPLDISPEELTKRFVRGDKSRNQEGNGLGLSIAKELCKIQNGRLELAIDGDLFKAKVLLPLSSNKSEKSTNITEL